MAHPQEHSARGLPHIAVPSLKHGSETVIIEHLSLTAEIGKIVGFTELFAQVIHKFTLSSVQVMIIPCVTYRPSIADIHHGENGLFGRY